MTNSKKDPIAPPVVGPVAGGPIIGSLSSGTSFLFNEDNDTINSKEIKKLKESKPFWRNFVLWDYNGKKIRNSPAIRGASIILLISLFILILPLIGIIPNSVTVHKNIHSNGQQTLNTLDSIYYSSRFLSIKDTADFNIQTTNDVTFAVFNKPIDQLGNIYKKNMGSFSSSFNVTESTTEVIPVFLFKDDSIVIHFSATTDLSGASIDPLIIYNQDLYYEFYYYPKIGNNTFSFTAPVSDTWYLSWGSAGGRIYFDLLLTYNLYSIDLTSSLFVINNSNSIDTSFTALQSGNYSFLVYYNQSNLNNKAIISYSNTFHISNKELNPIIIPLILISYLMTFIIIISFIQKISYKINKYLVSQREKRKKQLVNPENLIINPFCNNCGIKNSKSDMFCSNCGAKLRKGDVPIRKEDNTHTTKCSNCGNYLYETSNFCEICGARKD